MKFNKFLKIVILVIIIVLCILLCYIFFIKKESVTNYNPPFFNIQDSVISEDELKELRNKIPFLPYTADLKDSYCGEKVTGYDIIGIIAFSIFKEKPIADDDNQLLNNLNSEYNFINDTKNTYTLYNTEYLNNILSEYHLSLDHLQNKTIKLPDCYIIILNDEYIVLESIETGNMSARISAITFSYTVTHEKDNLIMEEKKIFMVRRNGTYNVYRTTNDAKNNLNVVSVVTGVEDFNQVVQSDNENIVANASVFQSTFKKDANGEYYWYSTEMIK